MDDVTIVEFDELYASDFASLNYQWIEEYFVVEPHDKEMLDNPAEYIIEKGGQIFFAIVDDETAGTVALINERDDRFELAKMAVSPAFRGRGIGDKLIEACVRYAKRSGKSSIVLLSNTLLTPAINLYRKHGFLETPQNEGSPYERVNIRMELAIGGRQM